MRAVILTVAFAYLVIPPLMADPAPTQTPARLEQSAPAAPAPGLPSQTSKAAEKEQGKAQTTAQLAAKTPAKDSISADASANVDSSCREVISEFLMDADAPRLAFSQSFRLTRRPLAYAGASHRCRSGQPVILNALPVDERRMAVVFVHSLGGV